MDSPGRRTSANLENRTSSEKQASVLEGDGFNFDKLLLRETSLGKSSRIYYRGAEGVPFQWEAQPGTPLHPLQNEAILPLNPPPAVQGIGLPKPCIDLDKDCKSHKWRVKFWKRDKKRKCNGREKKEVCSSRFDSLEMYESDNEFMGSFYNKSSSSSSTESSSNCPPVGSPDRDKFSPAKGAFVCSPWNISEILARVAKRF